MGSNNEAIGPVGASARRPVAFLVCFAVKEEAAFFRPDESGDEPIQVCITGMGRKNAADGIRRAVASVEPECVLTCGFAGGLNPALELGAIVFDEDYHAGIGTSLIEAGAVSGRFHCSKRVA